MDLKELSQLRAQSDALGARRHASAVQNYELGLKAFTQAADSDFHDKQSLHEAFDIWIEAIRTHRQNPKPYIGVGYIFMLLGDTRNALTYFKSAQIIEPGNADAAMFLEALQTQPPTKTNLPVSGPVKQPDKSTTLPPAGFPIPQNEDEFDLLYEQTESLIYTRVRMASDLPPPELTLDNRDLAHLKETELEQTSNLKDIQVRLKILDQEFDISPLMQMLRPFESLIKRYSLALEISIKFLEIANILKNGLKNTADLENSFKIHGEIPPGQSLEVLLDQCDECADRLDDFENQGVTLQAVTTLYERLVSAVSSLQEMLDDQNDC